MGVIIVLDTQIRDAGVPIDGVSDRGDGTYRVDFRPEATPAQRSQAAAIAAAFDPVAEQVALDALAAGKAAVRSGAIGWFTSNPGALALFDLPVATLETEINTLVDVSLPLVSGPNRVKWKRLLMGLAVAVRVLVKREGLG